jgi:hypothetical protein
MKYWCGWTCEGFDTQAGGKYGLRGSVGTWARGDRWFSWSKDGGGSNSMRSKGCGDGSGVGEKEKGDSVRVTGD